MVQVWELDWLGSIQVEGLLELKAPLERAEAPLDKADAPLGRALLKCDALLGRALLILNCDELEAPLLELRLMELEAPLTEAPLDVTDAPVDRALTDALLLGLVEMRLPKLRKAEASLERGLVVSMWDTVPQD